MSAVEVPSAVRDAFEKEARRRYGEDGTRRALREAVELWLAQSRVTTEMQSERELSNQAYQRLKHSLEEKHTGKCVVIAHGAPQAVADTFEELQDVAPEAKHRIVFRVGETPSRERELGWRSSRRNHFRFTQYDLRISLRRPTL